MHPLEDRPEKLQEAIGILVDFAESADLRGQSRAEVGKVACLVQKVRAVTDGIAAEAATEATLAACAWDDGLIKAADYVALHTPANPATVRADDRVGAWVRGYSVFRRAMLAGDLPRDRVNLLYKHDNPRTRDAMRRDEWWLANAAQHCAYKDFEYVLAYWLKANDPDGKEPAAQQENRKGTCTKDRTTGVVTMTLTLPADKGHIALTAFDQEMDRLRKQDAETGLVRDHEQRGADAGLNLLARGAIRPDGTLPAPLLCIVMGIKTAQQLMLRFDPQPGDPDPQPGPIPVNPCDPDWRCELIDGTPIHPFAAYHHMGSASIRRMVLEPNGDDPFAMATIKDVSQAIRPQRDKLNYSRLNKLLAQTPSIPMETKARNFTPILRIAAIVASRGRCTNKGCTAKTHWLHIDHHVPHSRGGKTHLNNARPLCGPDNHIKGNTMPLHIQTPSRK